MSLSIMDITAKDPWSDDLLNRKQDAQFIYNFLMGQAEKFKRQGRRSSYVLNLDAEWGGGKSFFLERFSKDLKDRKHIVVEINAWRSDYADDPYVAIMAAFEEALSPLLKSDGTVKAAWKVAKEKGGAIALRTASAVGKGLARKALGIEVDEILGTLAENGVASEAVDQGLSAAGEQVEKLFDASMESLIANFQRSEKSNEFFQRSLEKMVHEASKESSPPVFVIIDELDRCRPSYAIALLERVKHLFCIPDIVFIFGTNTTQLSHCIAGAYGVNFDGSHYLNRFFDRTYKFMPPSIDDFVKSELSTLAISKLNVPMDKHVEVIARGIYCYNMDLRSAKSILEMMDAVVSAWPHKEKIEISLLLPLCVFYFKERKTAWPGEATVPANWKCTLPQRMNFHSGMPTDRSITFRNTYRIALDAIYDLKEAVNLRRIEDNPDIEHITDLLSREWSSKYTNTLGASVQTELLQLVVNAGRLTSSDIDATMKVPS